MTVEDARRIVSLLRLTLPYRDKCALVTLLADAHGWHAASDVADLLDLDEAKQESIYRRHTKEPL